MLDRHFSAEVQVMSLRVDAWLVRMEEVFDDSNLLPLSFDAGEWSEPTKNMINQVCAGVIDAQRVHNMLHTQLYMHRHLQHTR